MMEKIESWLSLQSTLSALDVRSEKCLASEEES